VIATALKYWNTLRYLRPVQIYGRLWFRTYKPRVDLRPASPLRSRNGLWERPAERAPSFEPPSRFSFLDETHTIAPGGWDDTRQSRLWRYNLHYFDDLNAAGAGERREAHEALIARWIRENPPGVGTAWEPYPTSLRIVNWVKWALAGNTLQSAAVDSLATQARWLTERLERHLLGNHLFSNAKALSFAGAFFDGPEAERWRRIATVIFAREVREQILEDGGQFERSPMYHALALEDMLDLVNLGRAYPGLVPKVVTDATMLQRMLAWLSTMIHPDGEISFFNDASIGIAPVPADLFSYAERLGIPSTPRARQAATHLPASGYGRLERGPAVVIADVGLIGPDYLPAHAHADTLSFELSLGGQRVIVNSGTSRYAADDVRAYERGTAAHNTVVIDGLNSSEVWGAFRVARRARPISPRVSDVTLELEAGHDGYGRLAGSPVHHRRVALHEGGLEVHDVIKGRFQTADAFLHLHPSVRVLEAHAEKALLRWPGGTITVEVRGGALRAEQGFWSSRFGKREPTAVLRLSFTGDSLRTGIAWTLA
jgi:uncharacterized heparinase superfamily protein